MSAPSFPERAVDVVANFALFALVIALSPLIAWALWSEDRRTRRAQT